MCRADKTGVHGAPSSRLVAHQASLLLFCAMLGVVLSTHGGSGTLLGFFIGLSNAMMFLAHFILLYAPFGLFFATAAYVVQTRNLQVRLAQRLGEDGPRSIAILARWTDPPTN